MKTTIILFTLLLLVGSVKAQSLKEALYGGKLRADTGTVIKKGDSLKMKEEPPKPVNAVTVADSTRRPAIMDSTQTQVTLVDSTTVLPTVPPPPPPPNPTRDNNRTWKAFVDEYTGILNAEVLTNKKLKRGTYTVLIDYVIGLDGAVTTTNIFCTPENSWLVEQVKGKMMVNAPQLTPVLQSNGKPRKVNKKQMLTFVKEKN